MTQSVLDPSLFFKNKDNELIGLRDTLFDDTIGAACSDFADEEESKSTKFDVKPHDENLPFSLKRAEICKFNNEFKLNQLEHSQSFFNCF